MDLAEALRLLEIESGASTAEIETLSTLPWKFQPDPPTRILSSRAGLTSSVSRLNEWELHAPMTTSVSRGDVSLPVPGGSM